MAISQGDQSRNIAPLAINQERLLMALDIPCL
jgi:hypothetical protein